MDPINELHGLKDECQSELPKFKVDVYELRRCEQTYDFPNHYSSYPFIVQLFKTIASADVTNFEKLAVIYPEEAYMVAYKEKSQFLKYFILWDCINKKEVSEWTE